MVWTDWLVLIVFALILSAAGAVFARVQMKKWPRIDSVWDALALPFIGFMAIGGAWLLVSMIVGTVVLPYQFVRGMIRHWEWTLVGVAVIVLRLLYVHFVERRR